MNIKDKVAVCSRSLSANKVLRAELLSRYQHVKFNDAGLSLAGDELKEFVCDSSKVIVGLEIIDSEMLLQLPNLKVVSKYGVGIDMIDTAAFARQGIRLGWTGGVNKRAVSEMVVLFSLALSRQLCIANSEVKSGIWNQFKGNLLTGKTVGIVGFGNIGKDLSCLLQPFNCNILIYDKLDIKLSADIPNLNRVSFEELLCQSDIVSLHTPLNSETENMIGARELAVMKESAFLINTSRGGLVDESALCVALQSGEIAAAAFDVFSQEPPENSTLLALSNFISTPHMAGTSVETILAMGMAAIDGLDNNKIPENN